MAHHRICVTCVQAVIPFAVVGSNTTKTIDKVAKIGRETAYGFVDGASHHHITSHHIASHLITSHHITSHHITSHHVTSHHITSHRITSHRITPHRITSHHITSHHITSHRITSHRITSHHITSHHITSHHIAHWQCTTRRTATLQRCSSSFLSAYARRDDMPAHSHVTPGRILRTCAR